MYGSFSIIKFILKELSSGNLEEISYEFKDYLSIFFDNDSEEYVDSFIELNQQLSSILIVTDLDYNITHNDPSIINILNIEIDVELGVNFFKAFPSLKKLSFKKFINKLNINSQEKFELTIYADERLIHNFSISVLKYSSEIVMFFTPNPTFQQFEYLMSDFLKYEMEATAIIKDRRIVYVNDAFSRITGKSLNELTGLELYENMDIIGADNTQLVSALKNIFDDLSFYHEQILHVNIYGEERKLKIFISRAHVHNPFIEIVVLDLTEKNLLKEVTFTTHNNFHLLRSFGKIVSFTQDHNGNLLWSPEFYYIMGYPPSNNSLKDDLFKWIVSENQEQFQNDWVMAIKSKKDLRSDFYIETAEGRKYIHIYAKINYSSTGEMLSINGYLQDNTKYKFYKDGYEEYLEKGKSLVCDGHNFVDFNSKLLYDLTDLESQNFSDVNLVLTRSMKRLRFLNFINKYIKDNVKLSTPLNISSLVLFEMLKVYMNKHYDLSFLKLKINVTEFDLDIRKSEVLSFIVGGVIIDYNAILDSFNQNKKGKLNVKLVQNKNHIVLTVKGNLSSKIYTDFENTYMKSVGLLTTFVNGVFVLKDNVNGFTLKVKIPL